MNLVTKFMHLSSFWKICYDKSMIQKRTYTLNYMLLKEDK